MIKKSFLGLLSVLTVFVLTGCATGRNYDADISALNSKVAALQGEVSTRETAIAGLQSQLKNQEMSGSQAEEERRLLNERLNAAQAELADARAREARSAKETRSVKQAQIPDSDLK